MENRKNICLITNWYPTKEKPFNGIFFKEQAFVMSEQFDFTVLHYKERKKDPLLMYFFRSLLGKNIKINKVNEENNTVEYEVNVWLPLYVTLANILYDLYQKYIKHTSEAGVGNYISNTYQQMKRKALKKVFLKNHFEKIDVLYCVNAQKESYTLQCISEIINKPYVVAEHAPFPWPGSTLCDVEKRAIEKADTFLAISYDKIRQVMLQNVKLRNIAYVGNLVDEDQFLLKKENNKVKTFIIVAAHSFYKNYSLFIDVFNRLVEITEIPFKVMVVGYGSNKGYSKNIDELERKIKGSKFYEYTELIPEVSHEKIPELYARADAFVMTSIQEGMPVSALEAGCCGLPIFSTMCGGVEDYVDEKIGRIYKVIDSESFADGLKMFLEGQITFDSESIRRYIIEHYGKAVFINRMEQLFSSVIDDTL